MVWGFLTQRGEHGNSTAWMSFAEACFELCWCCLIVTHESGMDSYTSPHITLNKIVVSIFNVSFRLTTGTYLALQPLKPKPLNKSYTLNPFYAYAHHGSRCVGSPQYRGLGGPEEGHHLAPQKCNTSETCKLLHRHTTYNVCNAETEVLSKHFFHFLGS